MKLYIYLSGSIKKNGKNAYPYWTDVDCQRLEKFFAIHGYEVEILNPNAFEFQNNEIDLFKAELEFIKKCNLVLVELSVRRGIGVGVEMFYAIQNNIAVIGICPEECYYRSEKHNWVHPFVKNLTNEIFKSTQHFIDNYNEEDKLRKLFTK